MAGVAHDLRDELTVICAYASLGGEVSYDAELTESYFARIESAGKRAAHISERLLVFDAAGPSGDCGTKAVTWPAVLDEINPKTDRASCLVVQTPPRPGRLTGAPLLDSR